MAGVLERVSAKFAARTATRSIRNTTSPLDWETWQQFFTFGGLGSPLVQTTMGGLDREKVATSAVAAYKGSGPVFALVLARMQAFSQVRFQWTRMQGSQPGDLFGSAALKALEKPWPNGTTSDLLARMEMHNSIAGNAYVRRTRPGRLNVLRPDFVTIILGSQEDEENPANAPDVEEAGFLYAPAGGRPRIFLPSEVAHFAPVPDPWFHFLGQSWITPVLRELMGDQAAVEHKWKFFEQSATPNLAIRFDPGVTIDKVKAFKELLEEEHKGAWNAWKTLYLGGGADVKPVGMSFREMDYAVIQGRAESRLASAAGVSPSWVGFSEGLQGSALNAGNFDSARRRFVDGTLDHLWRNAAASLEAIVTPPDPGASLWYDSRVPIMRQDEGDRANVQQQEATTITALIRDGFTPESAIVAVKNNDWSLLVHRGLISVQLWQPGAESAGHPEPGAESTYAPTGPPAPAPSKNGKTPTAAKVRALAGYPAGDAPGDRSGMISLDLPPGTIPPAPGGVADHHITVVYLGPDVGDAAFAEACARAADAAAQAGGPLEGTVGGLAVFPPSDSSGGKMPVFAPVDLPGGAGLRAVLEDLSASEHADWVPHVTLAYVAPGEALPDPVPDTPVTFTHLAVRRGAGEVMRFPLGVTSGLAASNGRVPARTG